MLVTHRLRFDVRDFVCRADNDPEYVQDRYDAINRGVILVGHIPLNHVLYLPIRSLLPDLLRGTNRLVRCGLLSLAPVGEITELIAAHPSNVTLAELVIDASSSEVGGQLVRSLCSCGMPFRIPSRDRRDAARRRRAAALLKRSAPWLTFSDLFVRSKRATSPETLVAIKELCESGILIEMANDKCCNVDHTLGDSCVASSGKSCYIQPNDASCSFASDDC